MIHVSGEIQSGRGCVQSEAPSVYFSSMKRSRLLKCVSRTPMSE